MAACQMQRVGQVLSQGQYEAPKRKNRDSLMTGVTCSDGAGIKAVVLPKCQLINTVRVT